MSIRDLEVKLAHVKAHVRHTKSGKIVHVKAYTNSVRSALQASPGTYTGPARAAERPVTRIGDVLSPELKRRIPRADIEHLEKFKVGIEFHPKQLGKPPAEYDSGSRTIKIYGTPQDSTIAHELGHAMDHSLGWVSESGPYRSLVRRLPAFLKGQSLHNVSVNKEVYAGFYAQMVNPGWAHAATDDSDPLIQQMLMLARQARVHRRDLPSNPGKKQPAAPAPRAPEPDYRMLGQELYGVRREPGWVDGPPDSQVPELQKGLGRVAAKHPKTMASLKVVRMGGDPEDGKSMIAYYQAGARRITFTKACDPAAWDFTAMQEAGWWVPTRKGTTLAEHVAVHESSHHLAAQLSVDQQAEIWYKLAQRYLPSLEGSQRVFGYLPSLEGSQRVFGYLNDGSRVFGYQSVQDQVRKIIATHHPDALSQYGYQSCEELLAEAYAEYLLSDHPREIAQIVGGVFEELP